MYPVRVDNCFVKNYLRHLNNCYFVLLVVCTNANSFFFSIYDTVWVMISVCIQNVEKKEDKCWRSSGKYCKFCIWWLMSYTMKMRLSKRIKVSVKIPSPTKFQMIKNHLLRSKFLRRQQKEENTEKSNWLIRKKCQKHWYGIEGKKLWNFTNFKFTKINHRYFTKCCWE